VLLDLRQPRLEGGAGLKTFKYLEIVCTRDNSILHPVTNPQPQRISQEQTLQNPSKIIQKSHPVNVIINLEHAGYV